MKKSLVPLVAGLALAVLYAVPSAFAGVAAPMDVPDVVGAAAAATQILPTDLFDQTVDTTTLGASSTDVATAGMASDPHPGSSQMLIVDDDHMDCPNAQFMRIQDAVNAAQPGATIKVCRGTYPEQVKIPAGKDGLKLFSVPDLAAVIKAPTVMTPPKAIVEVNGAHDVTLAHFTITGPGALGCDSLEYGVLVDNGGSALVASNHVTKIEDSPFGGCQNGIGIRFGSSILGPASGSLVHNLIDQYQKGGVVIDGSGTNASAFLNWVQGIGPTDMIAQNGIQISRQASADVEGNVVTGNSYSPYFLSYGVLDFGAGNNVVIAHNDVYKNDEGIGLFTVTNEQISHNSSHDNYDDGIFADTDTSNNVIDHNAAFRNGTFDCQDESVGTHNPPAMVANYWIQDFGFTENKPGLCRHSGDRDDRGDH